MRRASALLAVISLMASMLGLVVGVAAPASAAARDGVCDSGEFCYYYNSDNAGSISDFAGSVSDYATTQPSCYDFKGAGDWVRSGSMRAATTPGDVITTAPEPDRADHRAPGGRPGLARSHRVPSGEQGSVRSSPTPCAATRAVGPAGGRARHGLAACTHGS